MIRYSRFLGFLAVAGLLTHAGGASADAPTEAELQAARTLFADAEKDEDAEHWSDALVKLKDVARLKLTPGIRYHMALCEEHLGYLASALKDYSSAEDQAHAEKAGDVKRLVGKRLVELSVRVPQLVVVITRGGLAGMDTLAAGDATITVDGDPIVPAVTLRVDPGAHVVEVHAPGHDVSSTTVTLTERQTRSIEVDLGPLRAPAPAGPPPPPPATKAVAESAGLPAPGAPHRTLAIVAAGGAVGLTVVGIVAFVVSGSVHDNGVDSCATQIGGSDLCSSQRTSVRALDGVALGAWIAAAAAATVAVVSFARSSPAGASASLAVGPGAVGLRGAF